jgi:hypothetical protein
MKTAKKHVFLNVLMESSQQTNTVTTYQLNAIKQDGGPMILVLLIFAKLNQLLTTVQEKNFQTSNMATGNVQMAIKEALQNQALSVPLLVIMARMFIMHTNALLTVIGSKNMAMANANAKKFAIQRKNVVTGIQIIQKIKITTNFAIHAPTIAQKKRAARRIFHPFLEMETGDALGSRMARVTKNMHVSSCVVRIRPNKLWLADPMIKVSVNGEVM